MPAVASCTDQEKVPVSFTYTSTAGRPAQVQGQTDVTITAGDGTFERTGDHAGFLVSGIASGVTSFAHTADADLGVGVVPVSDFIDLTVTGEMAAAVGVTLGAPVPKA